MSRVLSASLCLLLLFAPGAARASERPATIDDVIQLVQTGLSDETIITFLETRGVGFVPGPQEIVRLRTAGVSEDVIRYLLRLSAAIRAPAYSPPVGYAPGYAGPGYPVAYSTPVYAAGAVFSVGFPIVPHWLRDHHISHVVPHGVVGHVFGGGVHVITGRADVHHGLSPFTSPVHPNVGHGVTSVGFTTAGVTHAAGARHIGTVHGAAAHGGAVFAAASGGHIAAGHGTATHGGSHAAGHGGGHSGGH